MHEIPANDSKGEPAHHHADVRYLFSTTGAVDLSLQDEEVSGYVWRSPDAIEDERLRSRVIAAVPSGA
ncbi:NUDIX hydrolase [Streptomyces corynorhini]|uniref:NUDIX hydrolase n=1 Tax=Streptomyces corynorhini TaxID=2282652 RepID=A0A370B886_9ACTN|nr:hypothetical protein [Streptomyces corynorhini]RDG36344.1 hypothetical protein DVH02_20480 [Streptomyces corynorhini]